MTLFGSLSDVRNAASVENPEIPLTSPTLLEYLGGSKTHAGVEVTEKKALGISAVWRAVLLVSGTCASLPLHAFRSDVDGRLKVPSTHRAARLLDDPHPDMTPFELWETAYCHHELWGNVYLRKLGSPAMPLAELWPIHPGRVKVGRVSETGRKIYSIDGGQEIHTDDTILHIPGFGYDGVCGVSPIRAAREGLALALAAEEFGGKFFANGSLATGVLQTEQRLTQRQADALHTRWRQRHSGLQDAHGTVVLDRGAQFHRLSIPPGDAQFIETRRFQVSEVARIFGVPPHMLMDTEKSTSWGSGIEQQTIGFTVFSLRPRLTRFEQRITKVLRPQAVYAKYALEGLLRGDSAQRAAFYRTMIEIGAMSANEVRELEERGPIDGGDEYLRPGNLVVRGESETPEQTQTVQQDALEEAAADA